MPKELTYKQAWEQLKVELRARGEWFFFAKGDDESSLYKLGQKSIDTTLEQMQLIEKRVMDEF